MLGILVRVVAFLLITIAANGAGLRVGAARNEITDLAPPAQPASGKYAHERLFIRAIVLDNGTARAALIGADRADMDEPIWQIASKSVATELGCPLQNIVMSATHSHSAFMPTFGPDGPHVYGDPSQIAGRILDAVKQAKAALQPALVGFGTGQSYLNVNRDNIDPNSHLWTQAPNLAGISDKTVAVIKFAAPSGELIAVYMTYAMHPVNGYLSDLTSADYASAASRHVEQAYDDKIVAVFAQGASGDQNPLYLRASTNMMASRYDAKITGNVMTREPIEAPLREGKVPAHKADPRVADTLEKVMESEGVLLGEEVIRVLTNTTRLDPLSAISGSQSGISCPGRKRLDRAREGTPGKYEDGDPVQIRIGLLRVGNIALAWANAEIYTTVGLKLKAASPLANTLLVTVANGRANSGYVPNDTAFGANTFQVLGSRLKPGCAEDAIVIGLLDLIQMNAAVADTR
jgi:neutral ceramidase